MTKKKQRALCWLIALLLTAALFTFVVLCLDWRYATNDDSGILRPFMGYETGEPASFHILLHGLLALPLHWLGLAFPGVAWFSWMQLAFLALACVVISKSIMQCFLKHDKPLWLGAAFSAVFLFVFALSSCTKITFTQTAALLGAAAVLQMYSIEYESASSGAIIRGMLGAGVLVAIAYALRQDTAMPVLALCGLAFVTLFLAHYGVGRHTIKNPRPMLVSLALVAVLMGGMFGSRVLEIKANDAEDYLAWRQSTLTLMDYTGMRDIPSDVLEEVGWSENTCALTGSQWFFLDSGISTEAFNTLTEYKLAQADNSLSYLTGRFWKTLGDFFADNVQELRCLISIGICFIACVLCAAFQKKRRGLLLFSSIGAVVLFLVMFGYLAWRGRLPLRAVLTALLPLAATLFALLPACLPPWRGGKTPCLAVMVLLVCAGVYYGAANVPRLWYDEAFYAEFGHPIEDLYAYALSEPDTLFIHDLTLVGDRKLFPNYADGVPHNITCWGGWTLRSKESIEQFANWDIDLLNFDPEAFLRDDVCFASGVLDPPPNHLLRYLHEKVDPTIECELYGENGFVYIFKFYIP